METYYSEQAIKQIFGDYGVEQLKKYLAEKKKGKRLVGGRIFFIDEKSTETVVFYDKDGNEIKNVSVGDTPYSYEVVTEGKRPKYWVYHNKISKPLMWKPSGEESKKFDTSEAFGDGMKNTIHILMDTNYFEDDETIWNYIHKMRDEEWGGCHDWFIPSKEELKTLRHFFEKYADDLMLTDVFNASWVWTSSEYSASNAWLWGCNTQSFHNANKDSHYSVFGVRAF